MGGREASSSTNIAKLEASYKKEKADSWDRLMNDIKETRERQKQKANEYIKQGIQQPEAFARAKQEFEKEFEKLDREEEQRSFDINEKYRKKGLLTKNNEEYVQVCNELRELKFKYQARKDRMQQEINELKEIIKKDYISKKKLYKHIEMLEKENCHETCGIKKLIDCGRQCSIGCTIKNIKKILEE